MAKVIAAAIVGALVVGQVAFTYKLWSDGYPFEIAYLAGFGAFSMALAGLKIVFWATLKMLPDPDERATNPRP